MYIAATSGFIEILTILRTVGPYLILFRITYINLSKGNFFCCTKQMCDFSILGKYILLNPYFTKSTVGITKFKVE